MLNPQTEYDQMLPEEHEAELDLEDALDNLECEKHDRYISEVLIKALSIILTGCNHDLEGLEARKRERNQYSSQSSQFKDIDRQAKKYRDEVHNTMDKLVEIMSDEQKEKLLEYYKELV